MGSNRSIDKSILEKSCELGLRDSVARAEILSYLFVLIFSVYGLISTEFIQKFEPSVSIWDNTWPRLLFNSLPLALLGLFMRKSKASNYAKLLIWTWVFSGIVNTSAWVYVWQIALFRSAEILTYVHAANTYLLATVYAVVAPPRRYLFTFTFILSAVFVVPLFVIAYYSHDRVILNLIVGDSIFSLMSGMFIARMVDRLRSALAALELEKTEKASQFLGPILSKAIFNNELQRLERAQCKGFVACLDIRGSTDFQKKDPKRWWAFRSAYFSAVSLVVRRHGGYIQKTAGDAHVINFGIMDYVDLTEIPGIQEESKVADERRLYHVSRCAMTCLDELYYMFNKLSLEHYPEGGPTLGGGLDKGVVERSVQGSDLSLELDVNGDPVNCCHRLQDYSKTLRHIFAQGSSLLVISPFASDYLETFKGYTKLKTEQMPVRDYAGQIKWVLVKEYLICEEKTRFAA